MSVGVRIPKQADTKAPSALPARHAKRHQRARLLGVEVFEHLVEQLFHQSRPSHLGRVHFHSAGRVARVSRVFETREDGNGSG
jgi:hypothetical protein